MSPHALNLTPVERAIVDTTVENVTATTTPANPAYYEPTPLEKFERFFEELSWRIRRSIDRSLSAHRRKSVMKKKRGTTSVVELDEKTEYWVEEFEIVGADELEEQRKRSEAEEVRPQWISTTTTTVTAERPKMGRRKSTGGLLQFLTSAKSTSSAPSSPMSETSPETPRKPKAMRRGTWKF
ncbi:hypothetical protein BJ508DRAFT_346484 [Ascobolus immersus RN42]|uniref:Uncharacterized protein n=1 Tax=Ascobolus immersus RN42 TaxID=1160509 RepID=A0A3N4IYG5_ASCIM|nr:hypothetical protein BJ508DRAFT_346484 [Ascobolus immersus RN42]